MNSIFAINHFKFIDRLVLNKRKEMIDIINYQLKNTEIVDALDIGSTSDQKFKSSNFLIKNINNIRYFKSISDQVIKDKFFSYSLVKSITDDFSDEEINKFKSDLVISNATIEHVGSLENQIKMVSNIIRLSKKFFILTTPNRFYPIDFHTKLPLIHWLPKKIHRKLLNILSLKFFAKEDNLNLMSESDLKLSLNNDNIKNYKILYIRLFGFKSNFLVFGEVN
ncbi:hypothetical protein N9X11_02320 [Candidatus Pelagibacter bacterium]|nr:hypothetical protein [Candidatus Pelagibacter bacterium]|tara:strand:+ start:151 stop:819 length:669 start_codon:yes stop_codon:yes gene_type:complete